MVRIDLRFQADNSNRLLGLVMLRQDVKDRRRVDVTRDSYSNCLRHAAQGRNRAAVLEIYSTLRVYKRSIYMK